MIFDGSPRTLHDISGEIIKMPKKLKKI